jgi:serine/threonine protein kinase
MIGRIIGNRYEIIEKIGGGGMSNVYKAKCNVLNRYVAIKILRDELTQDSEFVEKFKQESLSAASLTHPNIVNIYDTGIEDDIYYIVMEYVKGETLKNYIKRMTRLSEEEAVKISRQVAEALRHAHLNNIVHRDIKPHNILLTEDGTAKVTDFGIARASTSSTINNTSNVIGSVHYFSPEQARGGYVDEKSDIYSLGIVMYEMVTGTLPFDADNHISVAMKQIQEKPVPPSKRVKNVNISKNYEDIIMKCLEKHQSFRFQNIDDLLKKLNALNGNSEGEKEESEIIDSPTIEIPALNKVDENVINIDPATITLGPQARTSFRLEELTPPSISTSMFKLYSFINSFKSENLYLMFSMRLCPPKPGFTLINKTISTSLMISFNVETGVAGFKDTPAFMP